LLYAVFQSDSEYERLLLIHTPLSYKLNLITSRTFTVSVENMSVTAAKSESRIGEETEKLEDLLSKVVIETLKQVFKEDGAETVYAFIENNSHLKRKEIVEKPEVFSEGLGRILGSGGSVIESLILKNLYRKFGLKFREKEGYEFSDYVKELRKRFEG